MNIYSNIYAYLFLRFWEDRDIVVPITEEALSVQKAIPQTAWTNACKICGR